MKRRMALAAAALMVASGLGAVPAMSADFAPLSSTDCETRLQKEVRNLQPDGWRAGVRCKSIQANMRVQPVLERTAAPDHPGDWFTQLNVWRSTTYVTAPFGRSASYRVGSV